VGAFGRDATRQEESLQQQADHFGVQLKVYCKPSWYFEERK
jgi:hypothetical protein